jgi:hypothetical protein
MSAFHRSVAMFAAISAIMAQNTDQYSKQQQIAALGQYTSRGKGGRKQPRTFSGVARARRESQKIRNKA